MIRAVVTNAGVHLWRLLSSICYLSCTNCIIAFISQGPCTKKL